MNYGGQVNEDSMIVGAGRLRGSQARDAEYDPKRRARARLKSKQARKARRLTTKARRRRG